MKTIHKKIKGYGQLLPLLFILSALTLIMSCKKFLVIPSPTTKLVTGNVFSNNATATSALTYDYSAMYNQHASYNMAYSIGMYADELQNYDTQDQTQIQLYTNSLLANNMSDIQIGPLGPWTYGYSYIYNANAVINGLQTTTGCSPAVKQQLTGEALFIRAFWHFYLTNIYGDVPLVLTPSYITNESIARTPRVRVLQQIVADLQNAKNLLNSNYVNASDTITTTERARPNKAVALALLARAYLYLGDYDNKNAADYVKADSAATAVINYSGYSLSPLNSVFLTNSTEAIWQLETPSPTGNWDAFDGYAFILQGAPLNSGYINTTTTSTQLFNAFETGDQRKVNWVGSITTGSTTYYFPYKYKQTTYTGKEATMVLRLGEQYLIRAEARVHEGNTTGALADLNAIRSRAGLSNYAGAQDQASLLAAVLHERQVEMFTEWGARWFDLERTGNANSVMSVVTPQKGGTWSSNGYQLLFPIPQSEVLDDHNLTQNPGY